MRCACIDIGTNTTRLLVAEEDHAPGLRVLAQERAFTELGDADEVGLEKTRMVADAVGAQVERARELGTGRLRVVATGALREAGDRDAVLEALRDAVGTEVDVLSGREEPLIKELLAAEPDVELYSLDVRGTGWSPSSTWAAARARSRWVAPGRG